MMADVYEEPVGWKIEIAFVALFALICLHCKHRGPRCVI